MASTVESGNELVEIGLQVADVADDENFNRIRLLMLVKDRHGGDAGIGGLDTEPIGRKRGYFTHLGIEAVHRDDFRVKLDDLRKPLDDFQAGFFRRDLNDRFVGARGGFSIRDCRRRRCRRSHLRPS